MVEEDWGEGGPFVPEPPIVPRSGWGAHSPGSYGRQQGINTEGRWPSSESGYQPYKERYPNTTLPDVLDTIVFHHEGSVSITDFGYSGAGAVLRLQEIAMETGSYDIDYHFVIDFDGTIYEGRDVGVRGSHVSYEAKNTGRIGVLWIGAFVDGAMPTEQQVQAAAALVTSLDDKFGIENVYSHGEIEHFANPNSDFQTECPGNASSIVDQFKPLLNP